MYDIISLILNLSITSCPSDMVHVSGKMINSSSEYVEWLQDSTCDSWIDRNYPARCAHFNRDKWLSISSPLPRKQLNYCIDNYEYPNKHGSNPQVYITWIEAKQICEDEGKRLCTEEEWTFACEGEEGLPYPYGYTRDPNACNIDKPWIEVNYHLLLSKKTEHQELDRLWQGVASGSMQSCISPFRVHDMTGNVDEWTVSNSSTGYSSILKGGYWSVVRNRCRPSTRSHNQWHRFYQQGFRCCQDIKIPEP